MLDPRPEEPPSPPPGGPTSLRDPRFHRELFLRGGMTAVLAAIAYLILHVTPWIWVIPIVVAAMVAAKWLLRPPED